VVGAGDQLAELLCRLAATAAGLKVTAVLDLDGTLAGRWPAGAATLHRLPDLAERVYRGEVEGIVLALPARAGGELEAVLRRLRHLPVDVSWAPELPERAVPILGAAAAGDVPLVRLTKQPLDGWRYVLKAAEDRALAALLLLFLAPLLAVIALGVRLDSPGKIFYRQIRHGFSREPIAVLKFRTMHQHRCDPRDAATVAQATRGDPRVTRLGRLLRRTSLDELPQLWNVLVGQMSLVGPRPHAVAHDQHYADLIDDYLGRQRVKPGITGWAQVNGCRGETRTVEEMRKRIELDIEYIDRWSILLDLRILCLTLRKGFSHRNAY
jgi:putative colanic acid biosynthesis UDP-glucose lipid carrier transferase